MVLPRCSSPHPNKYTPNIKITASIFKNQNYGARECEKQGRIKVKITSVYSSLLWAPVSTPTPPYSKKEKERESRSGVMGELLLICEGDICCVQTPDYLPKSI